jgi:hypothetical protein
MASSSQSIAHAPSTPRLLTLVCTRHDSELVLGLQPNREEPNSGFDPGARGSTHPTSSRLATTTERVSNCGRVHGSSGQNSVGGDRAVGARASLRESKGCGRPNASGKETAERLSIFASIVFVFQPCRRPAVFASIVLATLRDYERTSVPLSGLPAVVPKRRKLDSA